MQGRQARQRSYVTSNHEDKPFPIHTSYQISLPASSKHLRPEYSRQRFIKLFAPCLPTKQQANEHHERANEPHIHSTRHHCCTHRHVNRLLPCTRAARKKFCRSRASPNTHLSLAGPVPDLETDRQHFEPASRLEASRHLCLHGRRQWVFGGIMRRRRYV
jgi:hypothetical protein